MHLRTGEASMRRIRILTMLAGALIAAPLCRAEEPSTPNSGPQSQPAPKDPFYLITDYLPLAIYDADSVTGCFRVENTTGKEATLDLVVKTEDASGKTLEEITKPVAAPISGFGQCQYTQEARTPAAVVFTLRKGAEKIGEARVRLVRDADAWPETKIVNGRLVAKDNGDVVVPVIHRLLKTHDRAFVPLKWFLGDGGPAKQSKGEAAVAFIPGRWPLDIAAHNQGGNGAQSNQKWIALGPFPPDGSTPALRVFDQIVRALKPAGPAGPANPAAPAAAPLPARVAVCLPPDDLSVATDPRVYRIVVDGILARLQQLGIKQVIVVPPFQFGTPEKYWQRINSEVQEAAAVYGAQAVDPADFLNEKLWRVDPEVEGAYGASPNAEGLKKIEQGLADLLP